VEKIDNFSGKSGLLPEAEVSFVKKGSEDNIISVHLEKCNGKENLSDFIKDILNK